MKKSLEPSENDKVEKTEDHTKNHWVEWACAQWYLTLFDPMETVVHQALLSMEFGT